jgi:hypothetical protein
MKTRNKNKEVNPKHQKQVHEKKRQNPLWKQRNIGNKYNLQKKLAFKYYATREIAAYTAEVDKKVGLGQLEEEQANTMKAEFSHKIDILIQMWSEAAEKRLKEKIEELCLPKEDAFPDSLTIPQINKIVTD